MTDWTAFQAAIVDQENQSDPSPGGRIMQELEGVTGNDADAARRTAELIRRPEPLSEEEQAEVVDGLNRFVLGSKQFYQEEAFVGYLLPGSAKGLLSANRVRMKLADVERMNRLLIETVYNQDAELIKPHVWETGARKAANWSALFGNANLALLLSAVIAMGVLVKQRGLSWRELGTSVEVSLMSGGLIILITAAGGAFGGMLNAANVGEAIKAMFDVADGASGAGLTMLTLGFVIALVLKIAQGSSTVAMITGSAMLAGIAQPDTLGFHPVYLATAIGGGSLVGSWMNDSGFWIFAKMSGLTEVEALKSWTIMLVILGLVSFGVSVLLAIVLPNPLSWLGA